MWPYADWSAATGSDNVMTAPPPSTIRDLSRTAVRLDHYIHEGESEAVSGRMVSLDEALESPAANVRWESRAIVFDHQFCRTLMRMQPNLTRHPSGK